MNAVVVLETARRAVRAIVASTEERRFHHGTFLAPVTQEKHPTDGFKLDAWLSTRMCFLERPIRQVKETKDRLPGAHTRENIEIRCSLVVRAACEFC